MSIAQYLQSIGISGDLYKLLDVAYTTEYGCDIEQQSAINFLMLMNPDMHDTFNYSGFSDERYKIKGGNQLITDALEKTTGNPVE
jgi:monoamine oxidase